MKQRHFTIIFCCFVLFNISVTGQKTAKQTTIVTVSVPENPASIDLMIYGQMLEDCNDRVIYGGVVGEQGEERPHVDTLLRALEMPVMRWPAGTYIFEYHWENGVGPKEKRPVVASKVWGGADNHLFGTDDFLYWCKRVGTEPYINFNMGKQNWKTLPTASLGEALNWIEYVNGTEQTPYGQKRAQNGHNEPYNVKYWCIGNENYYGATAGDYAEELRQWASVMKMLYPDLSLIGVGEKYRWNDTILHINGSLIDFLTLHYYMRAKVRDNVLIDELQTTFAPLKTEFNIIRNIELLDRENARPERAGNPLRFSIDEWNCRHSVYDNDKFSFTRNDPRRLFDVATVAGTLNVFIRQSPAVGMANYIFPVNGHGLVRTVGEADAFRTPSYYVFSLYRKYMTGKKLDVNVEGPGIKLALKDLAVEGGGINDELNDEEHFATMIDGAATLDVDGNIHVALVNRSPFEKQRIRITTPAGYRPEILYRLESPNINDANTSSDRNKIIPIETRLSKINDITLSPCGFVLVKFINY